MIAKFHLFLFIIGLLFVGLYFGASSANAAAEPTFGALGPCPSCETPSDAPSDSDNDMVAPSQIESPSETPTEPCDNSQASLASHKSKSKHWKHEGGISKGIEGLIKLFMELLNMLLKLFGGGSINMPQEPSEPDPSDDEPLPSVNGPQDPIDEPSQQPDGEPSDEPDVSPSATPNPCPPAGDPSGTQPQPSSPMSIPSGAAPSGSTQPAPSGGSTGQKLGCGGVPAPAGALPLPANGTISEGGTAGSPKVYDGACKQVGTITIRANYVVVQNFMIVATGEDGISSRGNFVTIQNNDIKNVHAANGDGDLNAMNFFGNNVSIKYNTAINFVGGSAGGSHTDAIQTWNQKAGEASSNVVIMGNRFEGPPSEGTDQHIHQGVICEGATSTDGGGGGTGQSRNWLVADNYFTADLKFDDCDDIHITRNTFAGNDKRAVVTTPLSTGVKYYSDNKVTGQLSVGIGLPETPGAGPTTLPGL